jgi:hypothetical protein
VRARVGERAEVRDPAVLRARRQVPPRGRLPDRRPRSILCAAWPHFAADVRDRVRPAAALAIKIGPESQRRSGPGGGGTAHGACRFRSACTPHVSPPHFHQPAAASSHTTHLLSGFESARGPAEGGGARADPPASHPPRSDSAVKPRIRTSPLRVKLLCTLAKWPHSIFAIWGQKIRSRQIRAPSHGRDDAATGGSARSRLRDAEICCGACNHCLHPTCGCWHSERRQGAADEFPGDKNRGGGYWKWGQGLGRVEGAFRGPDHDQAQNAGDQPGARLCVQEHCTAPATGTGSSDKGMDVEHSTTARAGAAPSPAFPRASPAGCQGSGQIGGSTEHVGALQGGTR